MIVTERYVHRLLHCGRAAGAPSCASDAPDMPAVRVSLASYCALAVFIAVSASTMRVTASRIDSSRATQLAKVARAGQRAALGTASCNIATSCCTVTAKCFGKGVCLAQSSYSTHPETLQDRAPKFDWEARHLKPHCGEP